MRTRAHNSFVPIVLFLLTVLGAASNVGQAASEPEAFSVFPIGGQQGTALEAEIRGRGLGGAYAVRFEGEGLEARIKRVEAIEPDEEDDYKANSAKAEESSQGQRILLEVRIDPAAETGPRSLRVVSEKGVSNSLVFLVNSDAVVLEAATPHHTPEEAQQVVLPALVNGKIGKERERDYYAFDVLKGQQIAFEVFARGRRSAPTKGEGKPFDAIPRMRWTYQFPKEGRYLVRVESSRIVDLVLATTVVSFIPQVGLFETTGSWLNPLAPTRLKFDEDGRADFERQVAKTIYGRTSPDFVYQLRIVPRERPAIYEEWSARLAGVDWQERSFTRKLQPDRLKVLWSRTVKVPEQEAGHGNGGSSSNPLGGPATEGEHEDADLSGGAALIPILVEQEPNDGLDQALEVSVPVIIEGTIERPGDVDTFRFKVESRQPLAFEIETPQATPPRFYPKLELLDSGGRELLTNVHQKMKIDVQDPLSYFSILECLAKGAGCNLHSVSYLEALEAKVIETLEQPGQYHLRIRDLTPRRGGAGYAYRVLIRPQVAHVGEIELKEDRVNLVAGEARKLTVTTGQEEGFDGEVVIGVEGLPRGVEALTGTEAEDEGPLADPSVRERSFVPKTQKATIVLLAHADAPATSMPKVVRFTARPIVNGNPGAEIFIGKMALMVIRPTNTPAGEGE